LSSTDGLQLLHIHTLLINILFRHLATGSGGKEKVKQKELKKIDNEH